MYKRNVNMVRLWQVDIDEKKNHLFSTMQFIDTE